jgi:hypothetical protein
MTCERFSIKFSETDCSFETGLGEIQVVQNTNAEYYKGNYIVTPNIDEQTMDTNGKMMSDDVTIKAIPFFNVSNNAGGKTVYIGREIE